MVFLMRPVLTSYPWTVLGLLTALVRRLVTHNGSACWNARILCIRRITNSLPVMHSWPCRLGTDWISIMLTIRPKPWRLNSHLPVLLFLMAIFAIKGLVHGK